MLAQVYTFQLLGNRSFASVACELQKNSHRQNTVVVSALSNSLQEYNWEARKVLCGRSFHSFRFLRFLSIHYFALGSTDYTERNSARSNYIELKT